jgi:hypothetical protein
MVKIPSLKVRTADIDGQERLEYYSESPLAIATIENGPTQKVLWLKKMRRYKALDEELPKSSPIASKENFFPEEAKG